MIRIQKVLAAGTALAAGLLLSASVSLAQASSKTGPGETTDKMNPLTSVPPAAAATTAGLGSSDSSFLRKAAEGGIAEVALGNLAREKASDPAVKEFPRKMIDDHSKANIELKKLANQKRVDLPAEADPNTQKELDRLSKLSGIDFDRAYMKLMVSDHQKDVAEFNKQMQSATDPDVKAFVEKTLPTLQQHLQMARENDSKVAKTS